MIPGEIFPAAGEIELNAGATTVTLTVANTGDRPIQVGSHYHFFETNGALGFDRAKARGMRLDIAAGTAVRFEPGQTREVTLVPYSGARKVYGFNQKIMGAPLEKRPANGRRQWRADLHRRMPVRRRPLRGRRRPRPARSPATARAAAGLGTIMAFTPTWTSSGSCPAKAR